MLKIFGTTTKSARACAAPTRKTSELSRLVRFAATAPAPRVLDELATSEQGLGEEEALARLAQAGPNAVDSAQRASAPVRFLRCFANPFTLILLVLAAISYYTNVILAPAGEADPSTAVIIGIMVAISGILRFTQESRADEAADALKDMVQATALVLRAGQEKRIDVADVVPGDIVRLSAGDMLPADVRLISAKHLFVAQTALTGESEPVEKNDEAIDAGRVSFSGCANIAFSGTTVASGAGQGVVLATGKDSYLGEVAQTIESTSTATSFDKGVAGVSRVLVGFMLVMCPIVFVINGLTKGDWLDALLFSISIAVGITPQMLPVIVTTCLSRGATHMARENVIVKNINAIQNLGAMDVLCTDKTGTLTEDRVVMDGALTPAGNESARVLDLAAANAGLQQGLASPIDLAVCERARQKGANRAWERVDEIPFDFERRRLSVVVRGERADENLLICKGAAEEVIACCGAVELEGKTLALNSERAADVMARVHDLNARGLRVVALATRTVPAGCALGTDAERELTLVGLLTFLDPPKASAQAAIGALTSHGVAVKVLTGDNEAVAAAVCRKVGLDPADMLTGDMIDQMGDAELAERAEKAQLLAKLSPLQKSRVVEVLRQQGGHTVGFMGDGINDAAAMRASDCGISVDSAVDIAKEAADIILLKKDLMVLERGIVEGRRTYGNTIKYIKTTASSNFGNVLSVLVASAFLPFLPMSALQLLLLGVAYTISCTAIPWDDVDEEFCREPKTWDASSIVSFMLVLGPTSSVFDILTYAAMYFVICPMVVGAGWTELTSPAAMALFAAVFQTGWFVESMWTQTFVLHMLRTEKVPFFQSHAARSLTVLTLAGVAVATALPYEGPIAGALGLTALPLAFFGFLAVFMVGYMLLSLLAKAAYVRMFGELL